MVPTEQTEPGRGERLQEASSPAAYHDGALWWRGCFRTRDQMMRLHAEFAHTLAGDWFAPFSRSYAESIANAIDQYDEHNR